LLNQVKFRQAVKEDAALLFAWRNDAVTRASSHRSDEILFEDHQAWLHQSIEDPNRILKIGEVEGEPVGTVRADLKDRAWVLSWTVAPERRGSGIGLAMVTHFAASITEPIRAEVKAGNAASIKIAEAAGMTLQVEDGGTLHFSRGASGTK